MADDAHDDAPASAPTPGTAATADTATGPVPQPVTEPRPASETQAGSETHRQLVLSTKNVFVVGFLGTLGVLVALLLGGMIDTSIVIITYIAAGLFIALGLEPAIRLLGKWHVARPAAIAIVFAVFVLVVTAVLFAMIPALIDQATQLGQNAPRLFHIISRQSWFAVINKQFSGSVSDSLQNVTSFLSNPSRVMNIAGGVVSVGAGIANGIGGTIIVLVLTLYFMASLNGIKRALTQLMPASRRERFLTLVTRIFNNVGKYVMSQATIALINAVCAYIMMTILQIGFREVLAVFVFLLALLPLVGSISAGAIVVFVTLVTETLSHPENINFWPAIIMAIYYIIYMQFEAYVLTPRIVNRVIPLPGAVVVIAALLGGTLMGVFGALLSIPVAASVILLVKELWIPHQDRR